MTHMPQWLLELRRSIWFSGAGLLALAHAEWALACQPVMLPSKAALAPRDDCTSNCDLDLMYACKHGPEGKRAAALYDIAQG